MFGRATIRLGIGPHSSWLLSCVQRGLLISCIYYGISRLPCLVCQVQQFFSTILLQIFFGLPTDFSLHRQYYVRGCGLFLPTSSVVGTWSVFLSVTLVSPAKADEPIEMPFGLRTWVGPGNHVLDRGTDSPMGRAIL